LKRLAEALTDGHTELGISDDEKRLFDLIQERVTGAEETTEVTRETMQDLIGMHMESLSHDLNKTIRLFAALTVIIGVPSLVSTLLSLNLGQSFGGFPMIEIFVIIGGILLLSLFFFLKGWLKIK
jgi:Mg2+ and Co2+ transporter CorA